MSESLITLLLIVLASGCTISIIQTDTHGTASDVVDEQEGTSVQPDTNLSFPISKL